MSRKYKIITFPERREIERLYNNGFSIAEIAEKIGVHRSTLYRELERGNAGLGNNGRLKYSADLAQKKVGVKM